MLNICIFYCFHERCGTYLCRQQWRDWCNKCVGRVHVDDLRYKFYFFLIKTDGGGVSDGTTCDKHILHGIMMGKMNVYPAVLFSLRGWLGRNEFHVQNGRPSIKTHSRSCFVRNTCNTATSLDRLETKKENRVHMKYAVFKLNTGRLQQNKFEISINRPTWINSTKIRSDREKKYSMHAVVEHV